MGYDVHITRAEGWMDSETNPITFDEWRAYIESDPEMRLDGFAEAQAPGDEVITIESAGLSVWTAWPGSGTLAWMDHCNGRITVKNPDNAMLAKMCSIAKKLNARVQGDDGELYPDALDAERPGWRESPQIWKAPWWKRLLGR